MAREDLYAAHAEAQVSICSEDEARAGTYLLLGTLLGGAPSAQVLEQVRLLDEADGRDGFALAWEGLRLAAARVPASEVDDEYQELFIGRPGLGPTPVISCRSHWGS
jgi:TorA maturation chaperone TorD